MKRNSRNHHRRHKTLSEGIDITMTPAVVAAAIASSPAKMHHHHPHHPHHHQHHPNTHHGGGGGGGANATRSRPTHNNTTTRPRTLFGNRHQDDSNMHIMMETTTLEFLASMEADSTFFDQNPARPIASLERNEVEVAGILGMGEFGIVMNVTGFHLVIKDDEDDDDEPAGGPPALMEDVDDNPNKNKHHHHHEHDDDDDNSTSSSAADAAMPISLKHCQSCTALTSLDWFDESTRSIAPILPEADSIRTKKALIRNNNHNTTNTNTNTTITPLAMKLVRKDLYPKKKAQAAMDLAREAKFLASLQHANIVQLYGLVSQPGRTDFGIVIDKLPKTVEELSKHWKEQCLYSSQFIFPWQSQQRILDFKRILSERVNVLYDIARAIQYLHTKAILFRDLKPENCAQSHDGVVKLFDFGLAKELKAVDAVSGYNNNNRNNNNNNNRNNLVYKATGLTGTLRIMAPEVVQCQPYGLSADVYSFGVVMYEVFAGERCQLTAAEICKGQRPDVPPHMGHPISDWLQACWSNRYQDRPTMEQICKQMELEYYGEQQRLAPSATTTPEQEQ